MTRAKLITTLFALASLSACAGPEPTLYTLAAQPGTPVAAPARVRSVELRRIGLAGYLDRPGIVRSSSAYRLDVTQNSRWAAPIGQMLERVIAEDLMTRLPGVTVFAESGGIYTQPDRVLKIDIQRLDADPSGDVVLQAQVAIFDGVAGNTASIRSVRTSQRPASPAVEDQVAAMSAAVAALTDEIAVMLR
jgi:uncharacterized lipoprotein YmbA